MEAKEGHDKVITFSKDQNVIKIPLEKSLMFHFLKIITLQKSICHGIHPNRMMWDTKYKPFVLHI
jgi:hypothetical protein